MEQNRSRPLTLNEPDVVEGDGGAVTITPEPPVDLKEDEVELKPEPQTPVKVPDIAPRGASMGDKGKTFTFRLQGELKAKMKSYCTTHDISYAQLIRKSLQDFLTRSGY